MSDHQLWDFIKENTKAHLKPFDRDFFWISKEDFGEIKEHLFSELNFFHKGKSYRSKNLLKHIHFVDQGDHVFAHKDTGNVARFLPFGLLHFVVDVVPYLFFMLVKKTTFSGLSKYPVIKEDE